MMTVAVTDNTTQSAAALLAIWGLGYGAVPVTLQTRILIAAPDTTEAASSVYVTIFNLSIALGALAGADSRSTRCPPAGCCGSAAPSPV
jgi:predicted MFS family arabinose efflux permease